MSVAQFPNRFGPGFPRGVQNGSDLDVLFNNPVWSSEDSIVATPSGVQATSYGLSATISRVGTVASGNDGVLLPPNAAGMMMVVINGAGANTLKLFATGSDTINGTAGATGVSLIAGATLMLFCPVKGKWLAINSSGASGGAGSFTTLTVSGATTLNGTVEIGDAITDTIGLYGQTGVAQTASASQVAVSATAATTTTPWGFSTSTQANAVVTLVNELRANLVALGAIKGAS